MISQRGQGPIPPGSVQHTSKVAMQHLQSRFQVPEVKVY